MISAKNDFGVFPIIPKLKIRAADSQLTVSTESSTVYFAVSGAQSLTQNSLRIKGVGWVGQKNN